LLISSLDDGDMKQYYMMDNLKVSLFLIIKTFNNFVFLTSTITSFIFNAEAFEFNHQIYDL